eukprot:2743841-Prymnesium_polylepis.1
MCIRDSARAVRLRLRQLGARAPHLGLRRRRARAQLAHLLHEVKRALLHAHELGLRLQPTREAPLLLLAVLLQLRAHAGHLQPRRLLDRRAHGERRAQLLDRLRGLE